MKPKEEEAMYAWLAERGIFIDDLWELANVLISLYEARRQRTYKYYLVSGDKKDIWLKIAMNVYDARVDPELFIQKQFDKYGSQPPFNTMVSKKATEGIVDLSREREPLIDEELRRCATYLSDIMKRLPDTDMEKILRWNEVKFTPLFMWCVAELHGAAALAAELKPIVQSKLASPVYRKIYGAAFPEVIK
jgi:hypothetical protein